MEGSSENVELNIRSVQLQVVLAGDDQDGVKIMVFQTFDESVQMQGLSENNGFILEGHCPGSKS